MLLICVIQTQITAGQVPVSAVVSDTGPAADHFFEVTLSVDEETDFYSAALEVSFDRGLLEFVSLMCGGLSEGGIKLAGFLSTGQTGVSVSRTTPLSEIASGPFMVLVFKVKSHAPEGTTEISFSDMLLLDSAGETIHAGEAIPVNVEIAASISEIKLQIPAMNEIRESEFFYANALLFASGLSDNERILFQIGVSNSDTDPAVWDEGLWKDMIFESKDDAGLLYYSAEIGYMRPAGEWFIALRASLDGGDYIFGGLDGIWNYAGNPSARLSILSLPPFRYTLAKWDFENESLLPSVAVPENRDVFLQLVGANFTGFATGAAGLAANTSGWDNGGDGSKYWMIEFSTNNFISIELSSKQYGSGTGPRDFILEYSFDGVEWNMINDSEIIVGTNWTSGRLDRLLLPQVLEGREKVFLRWAMTSDVSIGDGLTGSSGTNRIDDIFISGLNPYPQNVNVFPGDANNDGVVNSDDVLPLGLYWLSSGPATLLEGIGFSPRTIEQWIPAGATYADTNGDGLVDHRDLLAVGLNFGKTTVSAGKSITEPLATLIIDPLEGQRLKQILLVSEPVNDLLGVAFSIEVEGIPSSMWEIKNVFPAFTDDHSGDGMISFLLKDDNVFEGAFSLKGNGDVMLNNMMVGFDLFVKEEWNDAFTIRLNRLTVSNSSSAGIKLDAGGIVFSGSLSAGDNSEYGRMDNALMQNYPNPFSSVTIIPFQLASSSTVKIYLTCLQGKVLAILVNGFMEKGQHEFMFDGSLIPPGLYFCKIITSDGYLSVIKIVKTH